MRVSALAWLWAGLVLPAVVAGQVQGKFVEEHLDQLDALFQALDPQHESVGPLVLQWESGQHDAAASALAAYFRVRFFDLSLLEPEFIPDDFMVHADNALIFRYKIINQWHDIASPESVINWDYRGPVEDKEVAWMLNRHLVFPIIKRAFTESGNAAYRDHLNDVWQDWITRNPYPDRLTFSSQWRALEAARRILNSWLHVFFNDSGLLSDETRLLVLASINDHADALYEHASFWGGNHLITEKTALLAVAHAFPEFKSAEAWSTHAFQAVSSQVMRQSYPDGSYKELSNHYQRVVLMNTLPFLELLRASNQDTTQSPVYRRIVDMWDMFAGVQKPDGSGPLSNASDREWNRDFLLRSWKLFQRNDWLAIATNGDQGTLPSGSPTRVYPWAGQIVIRNNWGPDADWIYFDAGPHGSAHQHDDRLHVSVSIGGRALLVDNGRYSYQPGSLGDVFKSAEAHSVALLDGMPAEQGPRVVRQPMPISFMETAEVVFTAARASFKPGPASSRGKVPWTRAIIYDKRGHIIVLDHLVTFHEQQVKFLWQFDPGVSEAECGEIVTLSSSHEGQHSSIKEGFYSPDYNVKLTAFRMESQFPVNQPTTFIWAIHDPESASDVVIEQMSEAGSPIVSFRLTDGGRTIAEGEIRLYPEPELIRYRIN